MSRETLEALRRGYETFIATGEMSPEGLAPDFVWDMSTFEGWPERQVYEGHAGAVEFDATWRDAWDDWHIELEDLRDAGDQVVAILRQRGRSKAAGLEVEMRLGCVWTYRDGLAVRMQMYADPQDALAAAGLE